MNIQNQSPLTGRPSRAYRTLPGLLLLGTATVLPALSAHADSFVVTNTNNSGAGSLRQAITDANATQADDVITFGVSGTITVTDAELPHVIYTGGALTITGPATGVTISGDNLFRIFYAQGANLTLSNLTLRNGLDRGGGGAIVTDGRLTITNCTLANNSTASSGGAIYSNYVTVIRNCTFVGNSAASGGALYNNSELTTIESSTITGNFASTGKGAGVCVRGDTLATVSVSNSIIADNRVPGGGADSGTDVDVSAGTRGKFVSQGYNAIGDGNAVGSFTASGDQVGVTAATIKLGDLASNGGPTPTRALLAGSLAIGKGSTTLPTDQRSLERNVGAPDIGAFEFGATNTAPTLGNGILTGTTQYPFSQVLPGRDINGDALSYAVTAGTLPPGLALASNGTLSGQPTQVGTFSFTVTVNDGKGGTGSGKFSFYVNAKDDGIAPILTHSDVPRSLTRDQLAAMTLSGTVRDVASDGVVPSGVARVQLQLRRVSDGAVYNGSAFVTSGNPFYPVTVGAGADTAATRNYTRSLSFVPSASVMTPSEYSLYLLGLDNAGNYAGTVIPVTIVAPSSTTSSSAVARTAPAKSSSGGSS